MSESNQTNIRDTRQNDNIGHDDESTLSNNKMDVQPKIRTCGPITATWRYNSDGTCINRPTDPNSFNEYHDKQLSLKYSEKLSVMFVRNTYLKNILDNINSTYIQKH